MSIPDKQSEDGMDIVSLSRESTLDQWLSWVIERTSDREVIECMFPSDRHAKEYLQTIDSRTEQDVMTLLWNFMVPSGSFGSDVTRLEYILELSKESPETFNSLLEKPYYLRLFRWSISEKLALPWEGTTWILELLPNHPKRALDVIDNFLMSHFSLLPDWRISGLLDAAAVIRAKFIGTPETRSELTAYLQDLGHRQFEHLIERLFSKMGYNTILTAATNDGGRDIIAVREHFGQKEKTAIECKLYAQPVGVEYVRRVQGVVSYERYNKGILVTNSRFTKGARKVADTDQRIELIPGDTLVVLLNEYLGSLWPLRIETLISASRDDHG